MIIFFFLFVVTLLSPQPTPRFEAQTIDATISIGYGLAIGDVDGDRKPDILLADQKQIVWYRNGDWKRFIMAENLTERDNVCIAARDLNGDGKVEVAVGAQWNPGETSDVNQSGSVHYLIRPTDPTQPWKPVRLYHEPTIHRMKWVKVAANRYQLLVVPLHGRDNRQGVGVGVHVLAYDFPRNPAGEWKHQVIDSTMHMTHNFEVLEEPAGTSLLIGSKEGIRVLTFQHGKWNNGNSWVEQGNGVGEVRRGLFRNGKFFVTAVEPMHGTKLTLYRPDDPTFAHVLADSLNQGHALACADLLGMGQSQIVVGWREPNAQQKVGIRLYIPLDDSGQQWKSLPIDDNQMACEDLQIADLNADGKPDIIASGRSTKNVIIYWNRSNP